jgi:hypothetical protein
MASVDCEEEGENCVSAACFWQGVLDGARPRPHGGLTSLRRAPPGRPKLAHPQPSLTSTTHGVDIIRESMALSRSQFMQP